MSLDLYAPTYLKALASLFDTSVCWRKADWKGPLKSEGGMLDSGTPITSATAVVF